MKQGNAKLLIGATMLVTAMAGAAEEHGGTASYDRHTSSMVTAARYEPRGAVLKVTNPANGRSVTVLVNDRGPFNGGRVLDLSTGAFSALFGGLGRGTGYVRYEVVSGGGGYRLASRGGSPRQRYSRHYHGRRHWHHR